jgi:hypothetical protein
MLSGAYSFLNTSCSIAGPGGVFNLGAGAAVAEEGISIEPVEDKNVMTIGADGSGQHSLVASDAVKLTINLLKTSPKNAALMIMYDLQSSSSSLWGKNVFSVTNLGLGDVSLIQAAAFKKKPTIAYKKEGEFMVWEFDAVVGNSVLGSNA